MDSLAAEGVAIDIAVEMPSSADLVDFIDGTDLVLTMLSRLARGIGGDMRVRESPFDTEVAIFQFWTTRTHRSPAHRWVRNVVSEIAEEIRAQNMPGPNFDWNTPYPHRQAVRKGEAISDCRSEPTRHKVGHAGRLLFFIRSSQT